VKVPSCDEWGDLADSAERILYVYYRNSNEGTGAHWDRIVAPLPRALERVRSHSREASLQTTRT
jgi:hypothetical protein